MSTNPISEARLSLSLALSSTGLTVSDTPPEIITPPRAVIQQDLITPSDRYGAIIVRYDVDLIGPRRKDYHLTQLALDELTTNALISAIEAGLELEQISAPFNVQDTEGGLYPAVTLSLTQEISLS